MWLCDAVFPWWRAVAGVGHPKSPRTADCLELRHTGGLWDLSVTGSRIRTVPCLRDGPRRTPTPPCRPFAHPSRPRAARRSAWDGRCRATRAPCDGSLRSRSASRCGVLSSRAIALRSSCASSTSASFRSFERSTSDVRLVAVGLQGESLLPRPRASVRPGPAPALHERVTALGATAHPAPGPNPRAAHEPGRGWVFLPFERTRLGGVFAGDWRDLMRNRLVRAAGGPEHGLGPRARRRGIGNEPHSPGGRGEHAPGNQPPLGGGAAVRVEDPLPAVTLWRGPDGRITEGFRLSDPRPD